MKLIIGGACQGKLEFAKERFGFGDGDVFTCGDHRLDLTKPCVYKLEEFIYSCLQNGEKPLEILKDREKEWENTVFICQDLSCGVVPLSADQRAWRQETGLVCQYLAKRAVSVSRIFCGLEQKLK